MDMPIVQIQVIEGRKQEQIQNLISNVTDAVAKSLDVDVERVRVLVNEIRVRIGVLEER